MEHSILHRSSEANSIGRGKTHQALVEHTIFYPPIPYKKTIGRGKIHQAPMEQTVLKLASLKPNP